MASVSLAEKECLSVVGLVKVGDQVIDLRTTLTVYRESIVMRILDRESLVDLPVGFSRMINSYSRRLYLCLMGFL